MEVSYGNVWTSMNTLTHKFNENKTTIVMHDSSQMETHIYAFSVADVEKDHGFRGRPL